jgi:hypothetical protein
MASLELLSSCAGGGHLRMRATMADGRVVEFPLTLGEVLEARDRALDRRVAVVVESAKTACRLADARTAAEIATVLASRTFQE